MKKFLIITACNFKYGDFLVNHWLKSLLNNINRELVDIVVLDYGLLPNQRKGLLSKGVKVVKCKRDGHIVNIRYRDMGTFLAKHKYEQILSCDSGDLFFQADITHLFFNHRDKFRVVVEEFKDPFMKYMLRNNPIVDSLKKEILFELKNKKQINGGFIIAPRKGFQELCKYVEDKIVDSSVYGPDQFLLNLFLRKHKFVDLGIRFNFIPNMSRKKIRIKNGIFLDEHNEPFPVVHNAGNNFRSISNFGYGEGHNKIKHFHYHFLRTIRMLITKK